MTWIGSTGWIGLLVVARLLVNALICRLTLGLRGQRLWRGAAMTLGADAIIAALAMGLLAFASTRISSPFREKTPLVLALAAFGLIAALLIWEGAIRLAARPTPVPRRRLGAAALALLLTALLVGAAALFPAFAATRRGASAPAQVTHYDVRVSGLPGAFDGLRVCLVSDLHLGPHADVAAIRGRLRPLASVNADLMLFLGDYATAWPRGENQVAPIIAEQRAPLGVYAILGNHDRWLGEERSLRALRGAGVRVLVNDSVALTRGGDTLYLAGVDDPYTGADDLQAALAGVPQGSCVILMSHSPDIIAKARARRVALVVAGHTHGGQVNLPLIGPLLVRSQYGTKYAHGLFHEGRTAMFVTRGVGEIFPYIRLNCPREIAVLTLRRGREIAEGPQIS